MKAFTFKKSAVAAALLAVAGSTVAATNVHYGTINEVVVVDESGSQAAEKRDAAAIQTAYRLEASQNAATAPAVVVDATKKAVIVAKSGTTALGDNDLVTFTFSNGGLDANKSYKLIIPSDHAAGNNSKDDGRDMLLLSDNVFTSSVTNGVITSITFRTNKATANDADANEYFYLVSSTAANTKGTSDAKVNDGILEMDDAGLDIKFNEDVTAGSALSVSVAIDYSSASVTDFSAGSAVLARAFDAVSFTANTKADKKINFAKGALEFTDGKVSETGALALAKLAADAKLKETSVDWDNDGTVEGSTKEITLKALNTSPAVDQANADFAAGSLTASVDFSLSDCSAVDTKTASNVTLVGGAAGSLSKVANKDCTWTGTITNNDKIRVTVDGKTALKETTGKASYTVKLGSTTERTSNDNTVMTWSSNVQVGGTSITLPFVTAFNDSTSTFSIIKVDNSNAVKTSVAMSGTVEQIEFVDGKPVSTFLPFSNYKLTDIEAKTLATIKGDHIIDALITPKGSANFGFVTTALTGLKKEAVHHISVKLSVATAETSKGSLGKFEAYNASSNGRTSLTSGGQLAK